jgi:hypothetical protein
MVDRIPIAECFSQAGKAAVSHKWLPTLVNLQTSPGSILPESPLLRRIEDLGVRRERPNPDSGEREQ